MALVDNRTLANERKENLEILRLEVEEYKKITDDEIERLNLLLASFSEDSRAIGATHAFLCFRKNRADGEKLLRPEFFGTVNPAESYFNKLARLNDIYSDVTEKSAPVEFLCSCVDMNKMYEKSLAELSKSYAKINQEEIPQSEKYAKFENEYKETIKKITAKHESVKKNCDTFLIDSEKTIGVLAKAQSRKMTGEIRYRER